jgi:hypothetical protein
MKKMNIHGLKFIEVEKVKYSTIIKIQRVTNLISKEPDGDFTGQLWRSHIMSFVLTKLYSGGTIFAEFQEGQKDAKWWHSPEANPTYKLVDLKEEILIQDTHAFRSVIGNFGMNIMNKGYLGAGIFHMSFYDNPKELVRISCILSNMRETGFWIKIQNIQEEKSNNQ